MKKSLFAVSILLLLITGNAFRIQSGPGDWAIATGYSVHFSTSGDAAGIFKGLTGSIHFDAANLSTASFNVTVDVTTINTGNGLMNQHAKSDEWFDAAKFPQITFVSSKVTQSGATYQAVGTLTMHGVSKPFTLPFTFQPNATGGLFHANFTVDRTVFGIGKPGDVDDSISIELTVPVVKK
jgi:polyisoprenoid-binding protein YceI